MSTYLQFVSDKSREYYELTSGSWYICMEDLFDTLLYCTQNKKPFKDFVKKIKKDKVFDGFFDNGRDYVTDETERYFLKPLYDWAYDKDDIRLVDDGQLYEESILILCKDKGIKLPDCINWYSLPKEIEDTIIGGEYVVDKVYKCVGKMFYDEEELNQVGVSFERALAELKAGAVVHRKKTTEMVRWWLKNGELKWSIVTQKPAFRTEDILADDWEYHYKEDV